MANPASWSRVTRMDVGVSQKETIFNSGIDVFDAMGNGQVAISMSDANFTLSENQQSNKVLQFNGTLTAGRTVFIRVSTDGVVNARPNGWMFFNNTAQTLTFKLATVSGSTPTGFGTGATLATGKKAIFGHTNPAGAGASGDIFKWTSEV